MTSKEWTEVKNPQASKRVYQWEHNPTGVLVHVNTTKDSTEHYITKITNPPNSSVDKLSVPDHTLPGPFKDKARAIQETSQWVYTFDAIPLTAAPDQQPTQSDEPNSNDDEEWDDVIVITDDDDDDDDDEDDALDELFRD